MLVAHCCSWWPQGQNLSGSWGSLPPGVHDSWCCCWHRPLERFLVWVLGTMVLSILACRALCCLSLVDGSQGGSDRSRFVPKEHPHCVLEEAQCRAERKSS